MTQILPPRFEAASTVADVFIIGGGPAGATAATLLAQHGRSVVFDPSYPVLTPGG